MRGGVSEGLLEREHEIARIEAVIERAARGTGCAAMIEAPAGLGKTSLLRVAALLADQRGLAVLRARGGELERGLAFGVARDLLARRVAQAPDGLLSAAAGIALPALGVASPSGAPAEEPAVRHGLSWLVADLAEENPLALIVDDLQWSDAASTAWLAHLASRIADVPVALVLAARPPAGELEPTALAHLRQLPGLERVRPGPLGQASVAALVRSFYTPDADDRFIAACRAAAGGNPLHTHALLDAAAAQEVPPTAEGAALLAELAPDAVRRSVAAGLRRAGAEASRLATAYAVLGDTVSLRHAAALASLDPVAADRAADRLAEQDVLLPQRPVRFVHPVVLAAVRAQLPAGERAALHRRAADLFQEDGDVSRAAAHLLEVEPGGDERAAEILVAAAEKAAAEGAMAHAARLLERALAEPAPAGKRPVLLAHLGRARFLAGHDGAVRPMLEAAGALEDDDERAGLLATATWAAMRECPERVGDIAQRVSALPATGGEGRMRAQAAVLLASRMATMPGQPLGDWLPRVQRLPGTSMAERELLGVMALAATLEAALSADEVRSLVGRALSAPETTLAPAAIAALSAAGFIGATDDDLAAADAAIAACRLRGNQFGLIGLLGARSLAQKMRGRLRDAEMDARTILDGVAQEWTDEIVVPLCLYQTLAVLTARGLVLEAQSLLERHRPADYGPGHGGALLAFGAAALNAETGGARQAADALRAFDESLADAGIQHHVWVPGHRVVAVEALVRAGETDAARSLADRDLVLARKLAAPAAVGYALRAQGLAAGVPAGRALLEQAVPLLERAGAREWLARTLVDLGRTVRLAGSPTDARGPLRRALTLAEDCGAELLAQRAFDELRASGAKPRRRALRGPESLTPSEARVARLAADGYTNREIAQALYVSAKTVETHLGHVYAKLAISGRAELTAALELRAGASPA